MYIFSINVPLRIFNIYCIFAGEYCISSNRSPRLVLDTQLVFQTRLLLEEIRYVMLNFLNDGMPMRKCTSLSLLLSPLDCHIFGVGAVLVGLMSHLTHSRSFAGN